ncbi:VOC family protein [Paenibacillus sp. MBLB4367]|uniref:VOC family protein n=1 Tax=Paenibacillus sp. MBLB4367 TaxID=3384767 RepID=UPI0039083A40
MLTGKYGIMLRVKDLERSSSWYCTHLGFTLGPHDFNDFAELHVNGRNVLHLLKSDEASPMAKPNFGLYVNDAEDLHKTLKANGIKVTDMLRRSDHAEFLLIDLDGNTIGITQWFE